MSVHAERAHAGPSVGVVPPAEALRAFKDACAAYGGALLVAFGAAWCVLLALLWRFEEPRGKSMSVLAVVLAYFAAVALIAWCARRGLIVRPYVWVGALIAKMTLSVYVLSELWMRPLVAVDMVRTSTQNPLVTDSTFYDYLAQQIVQSGLFDSVSLLFATWQSVGIVGYGAIIYSLFGVSTLYIVAWNVVLALVAAIAVVGMLATLAPDRARLWDFGWIALFLPVIAYYDSMLTKEPLTNSLFYVALWASARLYRERGAVLPNAVAYGLSVILLVVVRPNAGMLALATPLVMLIRGRNVGRKLVAAGVTVALATGAAFVVTDPIALVSDLANLKTVSDRTSDLIAAKEGDSQSGVKQGVGALLAPRGSAIDLPLAPVRAIVWNYLPYPILVPETDLFFGGEALYRTDWNSYFKGWTEVARVLDTLLLIILTPYVFLALRADARARPGFAFVALNFLVPLLAMSTAMFIQGSRYRTLIDPLFVALAAWGATYSAHRAPRSLVYGVFAAGIIAFETLRSAL